MAERVLMAIMSVLLLAVGVLMGIVIMKILPIVVFFSEMAGR